MKLSELRKMYRRWRAGYKDGVIHADWREYFYSQKAKIEIVQLRIVQADQQARIAELQYERDLNGKAFLNEEKNTDALRARIAELEAQLRVAAHVKADDAVSFDWAVLGIISRCEELIEKWREEAENQPMPTDRAIGIEKCADELAVALVQAADTEAK